MPLMSFFLLTLAPLAAWAQALEPSIQPSQTTDPNVALFTGSRTIVVGGNTVTEVYQTYTSQITLATTGGTTGIAGNATQTVTVPRTRTQTVDDTPSPSADGSTATSGSLAPTSSGSPTNTTRLCNGYAELCSRKYSNITVVGTHNSVFVKPGNAASNQELDVEAQLDDGVRFIQAQIQWPTGKSQATDEPHFCHTSCDILDAGPITAWLARVSRWIEAHPREVITILLGNGPYANVSNIAPWVEKSNITRLAYRPTVFPMYLDDWPTLGDMIDTNQRVVLFMDYKADQTVYPWLLDEFSQMWETPFDPVNVSFPCIVDRPPNLTETAARDRLYLLNHNLNLDASLLGASILVPAVTLLNQTNSASGNGSLGESGAKCQERWGRTPNILNVDYYNYGSPPGSVFEAAAKMNGVRYSGRCCGFGPSGVKTGAARRFVELSGWTVVLGLVLGVMMVV